MFTISLTFSLSPTSIAFLLLLFPSHPATPQPEERILRTHSFLSSLESTQAPQVSTLSFSLACTRTMNVVSLPVSSLSPSNFVKRTRAVLLLRENPMPRLVANRLIQQRAPFPCLENNDPLSYLGVKWSGYLWMFKNAK